MRIGKILLCVLLLALPVLAEESEDRQTATSLHYVSHELDTRQDKLSTGTNAALTYTNAAGGVQQRTVKENLNGGTTDTSLPQVNAVNAGLDTKQNDIATIDDHTAVTYTGQTGTIGQKGIYQDSGTYATQTDNLIDAKTFNAALKNGLDSEFRCSENRDPVSGLCWLYTIHNTYEESAQPYVSATGTVVQDGTPTPTNPIYPQFFQQGNMILRKINDTYKDSFDATTHKITRRVGVKVLNGTEGWVKHAGNTWTFGLVLTGYVNTSSTVGVYCSHFSEMNAWNAQLGIFLGHFVVNGIHIGASGVATTVEDFKQWLAAQYAAGTPVTVYYPLDTPVEEDWTETTYGENVYIPQNQ